MFNANEQKPFESCEEKPQNINQWHDKQSPLGRGEDLLINLPQNLIYTFNIGLIGFHKKC